MSDDRVFVVMECLADGYHDVMRAICTTRTHAERIAAELRAGTRHSSVQIEVWDVNQLGGRRMRDQYWVAVARVRRGEWAHLAGRPVKGDELEPAEVVRVGWFGEKPRIDVWAKTEQRARELLAETIERHDAEG